MSDLLAKAVQELAERSATATAKAIRDENTKTRKENNKRKELLQRLSETTDKEARKENFF